MSSTISSESVSPGTAPQTLQCMEIIGGNQAVHSAVSSPGLDIWIHSKPLAGNVGGDIHYFSMCGSGRVTRLAVADISGHGPDMDKLAKWLRGLMRKHINLLDQTRFARAINAEFTQAGIDYFATVLLVTYFAPTDHLIVCNAGHPRPIWFSNRTNSWQLLDAELPDTGPSIREARGTYLLKPVSNLPLGVIEPTDYRQFAVKLDKGDIVLVYTDALIEASRPEGGMLGEEGLLELACGLGPAEPRQLADQLIDRVAAWSDYAPQSDDQTVVVLHHNAANPPPMTLGQALRSLSKMIGLREV